MADIRTDLELIGLRLVGRTDDCECASCLALDRRHDVDCVAEGPSGKAWLVSYRSQPEYDYQTITIRWQSDTGASNVQGLKIMDGRSRADVFVQGYPSGVSFAWASDVKAALELDPACTDHPSFQSGRSGQAFRILCRECCPGIHYASRMSSEDGTAA